MTTSNLHRRLSILKASPRTELVNDLLYIFSYGKDDNDQVIIYTGCYDNGDGSVSKMEDL